MNRKLRILLAEDEELCSRLFRRFLESLGYEVLAASDGREALQLFETGKPDLLLSDVDMPGMDGLQLLTLIRERNHSLPAILVSGKGDPRDGRSAAAFDFIPKPVDLTQLQDRIQSAIVS